MGLWFEEALGEYHDLGFRIGFRDSGRGLGSWVSGLGFGVWGSGAQAMVLKSSSTTYGVEEMFGGVGGTTYGVEETLEDTTGRRIFTDTQRRSLQSAHNLGFRV